MSAHLMMISAGGRNLGPNLLVATMVAGQNAQYVGYDVTNHSPPNIGSMTPQAFTVAGVAEQILYQSVSVGLPGQMGAGVWVIYLNSATYNSAVHSWLVANCKFFWFNGVKRAVTWGPFDPANKTFYVVEPAPAWTPIPVNGQSYKVGFSKT